jgi:hypothetical protein
MTIKVVLLHWLAAVLIAGGTALMAASTLAWASAPPTVLGPGLLVALALAIFVATVPLRPAASIGAVCSAGYAFVSSILIVQGSGELGVAATLSFGTATLVLFQAKRGSHAGILA